MNSPGEEMISGCGIGLRAPHVEEFLRVRPKVSVVEVYSEDYLGAENTWLAALEEVRTNYPLTLHGVGLSIGSSDPVNKRYLQRLRALVRQVDPQRVSDHLAWCSLEDRYFCDQYPLPRQSDVLRHLVSRIGLVQDFLQRPLLLENIAYYLQPDGRGDYSEGDFLRALVSQSGCQLLLDVENLRINCENHGGDPLAFLGGLPIPAITEIHVAGGEQVQVDGTVLSVDTHSRAPGKQARTLFAFACAHFPEAVRILEWDADLPSLSELVRTAQSLESAA